MPINQYTQDVIKQRRIAQLDNPQAVATAGMGTRAVGQVADFAVQASEQIQKKQYEVRTREETIQRARAVSQANQELQNEFVKFEQERDLTDPNAPKEFAEMVRSKQREILGQHRGSDESRASLETQLIGLTDSYTSKMTERSFGAQKSFIMDTVGTHINRIAKEVYDNPDNIDIAVAQLNGLSVEYGGALDTLGELEMIDAAQSQVAESALNSFLDSGQYEKARDAINENPVFIEAMSSNAQMSILGRINKGINAQEKERTELKRKIDMIKNTATELGVEVSGTQLFSAATGIQTAATPQDKIEQFAAATNTTVEQLPQSVVAKVGFGVDLPSADVDMNKERLPDGGYTPKGIGAQIKAPFESATAAKVYEGKINSAIDLFFENPDKPNSQALLSAMISFQKALDDGAVVRESDLQLMSSAAPMTKQINGMVERLTSGQPINTDMVYQMRDTSKAFFNETLQMTKTQIDPYLTEAQEKGYRMIDIGIPREAYESVYGGVKTKADTVNAKRNRIQDIAKQNGMTVDELIQSTATVSGKSIEQVKKDFGLND